MNEVPGDGAPQNDDSELGQGSYSQGRWVPPPFVWEKHSAAENEEIRRRQRSRALVTALALGALVILFFFISIARMG